MKTTKLSLLTTAVLLVGCGSDSESTSTALNAEIGSLPTLTERSQIEVNGTLSTFPSSANKNYAWTVKADTDGVVSIIDPESSKATISIGELAEDIEGTLTLKISDNDGNTDSQSVTFSINEIDKEQLPPEPGSQGTNTVAGIDSNDNGVRDDVEIGIYQLHELNHENREILKTGAKAFQEALTATLNEATQDNDNASEELAKFAYCLTQHSSMDRRKALAQLKTLQMNTPERVDAYSSYNQSRNGTIQRVVEATKEECILSNSQGGN